MCKIFYEFTSKRDEVQETGIKTTKEKITMNELQFDEWSIIRWKGGSRKLRINSDRLIDNKLFVGKDSQFIFFFDSFNFSKNLQPKEILL